METQRLNLLIPEDLPVQTELSKLNKNKVMRSLDFAFQALDADCQETAILKVNEALSVLNETDLLNAALEIKSPKKYREALEYDAYFNVNHVKSKEPEICLLKSILITYKRAILMKQHKNSFKPEMIEIHTQGFKTYFQLLSRVFCLPL